MNEEADVNLGNQQTEQLGYEKEVVVMHPNEVSRTIYVHYSTRKCGIGLLIRGPMFIRRKGRGQGRRRDVLPEKVVEERPKCWEKESCEDAKNNSTGHDQKLTLFAVPVIVAMSYFVVKQDGDISRCCLGVLVLALKISYLLLERRRVLFRKRRGRNLDSLSGWGDIKWASKRACGSVEGRRDDVM